MINLLEIIISKLIPFLTITNYWIKEDERKQRLISEKKISEKEFKEFKLDFDCNVFFPEYLMRNLYSYFDIL